MTNLSILPLAISKNVPRQIPAYIPLARGKAAIEKTEKQQLTGLQQQYMYCRRRALTSLVVDTTRAI